MNQASVRMLNLSGNPTGNMYQALFDSSHPQLSALIRRGAGETQWTYNDGQTSRTLAGIATSLRQTDSEWGVVVVLDDITHLVKSQREMAWREVARRIAHEIKNPLTPIKLSAQRLQRRLGNLAGKDGLLLKECTETIVKHSDELKEMVNEFSSFARLPEISVAPNDLNAALQETVKLYSQAHPQITFSAELEPRMPVFEFDRDQIKRVFVNLLDNAVAAMSERGGKVRMTTHYNDRLKIAAISIRDTGPGMTEEVKARLFEPYFSTKREGTGLGLAIVKRIINDHDGFIRVQSDPAPGPNQGTEFLIELPTSPRQTTDQVRETVT
jgi:two-component system nitrogen regulation sensor histidine kinase NtrY